MSGVLTSVRQRFAPALGIVGVALAVVPIVAQSQSVSVTGQRMVCDAGTAAGYGCNDADLMSVLTPEDVGATETCRTGATARRCDLNDLWGWTDPETGREFALVGREDGTAFVDVTDPLSPVYIGQLMLNGSSPSIWRDMKTYRHYAYIVADGSGGSGIQIFDMERLYEFTGAPITFEATSEYHGFGSAHNIVIDRDTAMAYVVGAGRSGETCGGGLHMVSLADPTVPEFVGCFSHTNTGRANTGYTHDAECVVYHGPDADYVGHEVCFGSNETHISIADVSDKKVPVAISKATYPYAKYVHQGWLTEDHKYFIQDDELDESQSFEISHTRTLIWDVTDLDDPVLEKEYLAEGTSTDHNLYVKGHFVYQSNYVDGLHILDISDIGEPVEVASFDTHPMNLSRYDGTWSNYPYFRSGAVGVTSSVDGFFMIQPTAAVFESAAETFELPESVSTVDAFPNPFVDRLTIDVTVDRSQHIRVQLYDALGREVALLFDGTAGGGEARRIEADVPSLPDGPYFYRILGEDFSLARPVMRIH